MIYYKNWKRLKFEGCPVSDRTKLTIYDLSDIKEAVYGEYKLDRDIMNVVCALNHTPKKKFIKNSAFVMFATDSPVICLRFSTIQNNVETFLTTGVSAKFGLSFMYSPHGSDLWFPLDATIMRINNGVCYFDMSMYYGCGDFGYPYRFVAYFPIFAKLEGLVIGIDHMSSLNPVTEFKSNVAFVGSKNTIGVGATVASLSIPNIVSRLSNVEPLVFYTASQNLKNELMSIDSDEKNQLSVYVIEYGKEVFENGVDLFIDTIRDLIISKPAAEFILWGWSDYLNYREIIDKKIGRLNNLKIIEIDESQISDFIFNCDRIINDSGNVIIAKKICSLFSDMRSSNGIY